MPPPPPPPPPLLHNKPRRSLRILPTTFTNASRTVFSSRASRNKEQRGGTRIRMRSLKLLLDAVAFLAEKYAFSSLHSAFLSLVRGRGRYASAKAKRYRVDPTRANNVVRTSQLESETGNGKWETREHGTRGGRHVIEQPRFAYQYPTKTTPSLVDSWTCKNKRVFRSPMHQILSGNNAFGSIAFYSFYLSLASHRINENYLLIKERPVRDCVFER